VIQERQRYTHSSISALSKRFSQTPLSLTVLPLSTGFEWPLLLPFDFGVLLGADWVVDVNSVFFEVAVEVALARAGVQLARVFLGGWVRDGRRTL
jgi:hypothetical protein